MKSTLLTDALSTRKLFVVYRLTPGEDGKTIKKPCHHVGGYDINGQDSSNWLLPSDASHYADWWQDNKQPGVIGYGVGLVIAEGSGLFFIDLDHCRDETTGGWFPHVASFENRFPGAYRETSVSSTGRHIIASYTGTAPVHGTRNRTYRMECYSKLRFVAVTGDEAAGAVLTDCTGPFLAFVAEFFPEHEEPDHGNEWTSAPVAAWKGPADDGELISRACRMASPKAVFGAGVAFTDLWHARADILGRVWPPDNDRDAWNQSSADQALANHLAFLTGNNCERMLTIMRMCEALRREKWDRPDYLRRTILSSTGTQHEWYNGPGGSPSSSAPVAPASTGDSSPAGTGSHTIPPLPPGVPNPPKPPDPETVLAPGELPKVGELCSIYTLKQFFHGYCYVQDINSIQFPDGTATTKERFDAMFGGPQFAIDLFGKGTKSAWEAYTLSEAYRFPRVQTQYFKPTDLTGRIRRVEGRDEINMYQPVDIRRVAGDATLFLDLIARMLPSERDSKILLCYMAACCRHLGTKFAWAPFLQGAKGNGKTTVAKVLEYCLSYRYTHWAKADQLGEKFNSVFVGKLLVVIDEMYSDDTRELQEILKQLVTATRIEVRPMYAEKTMKEICFNMFLISNHQNGVRIDIDERRYAALFCAQQSKADRLRDGLDNAYFIRLNNWLSNQDGFAIVYDYLMTMEIPDELNPATSCRVAPITTSTELAATASLGGVEQELVEAIKQGHEGFRGGWVSSHAVDMLLARVGKDKAIPRNARKALVTSLGYVSHPSLPPDGMCNIPMPDSSKPRLYIEKGHAWSVDYLTPDAVRKGYLDGQKG
jgi:hypothetical protein